MDYATTDLTLAIAHHLIFALAGVIPFEVATVRPGIAGASVLRVAKVDAWYGILAGAIILVAWRAPSTRRRAGTTTSTIPISGPRWRRSRSSACCRSHPPSPSSAGSVR